MSPFFCCRRIWMITVGALFRHSCAYAGGTRACKALALSGFPHLDQNSTPGEEVDAFNFPWADNAWCKPPFNKIGQVIDHVQTNGTRSLCLIIPLWVHAPWWNKVVHDSHRFKKFIHACYVLPWENLFSKGPKADMGPVGWETLAWHVECHRHLSRGSLGQDLVPSIEV